MRLALSTFLALAGCCAIGAYPEATLANDGPVPQWPGDPAFSPPPSMLVEGVVSALHPDGFTMTDDNGTALRVGILCPGDAIGLTIGDRVRVFGGPDGDRIASGAIARFHPDGRQETIADMGCQP